MGISKIMKGANSSESSLKELKTSSNLLRKFDVNNSKINFAQCEEFLNLLKVNETVEILYICIFFHKNMKGDLNFNKEQAKIIREILETNTTLKKLKLRIIFTYIFIGENNFNEGIKEIILGLQKNQNLLKIDLCYNNITDINIADFQESLYGLRKNLKIKLIGIFWLFYRKKIEGNNFSDQKIVELSEILRNHDVGKKISKRNKALFF